jgi:hypothetical protein
MQFFRAAIALGVLVFVAVPARAQPQADIPSTLDINLLDLARKQPECKEFKNACQVCLREENGELHCSNVSIACSPRGEWKCSNSATASDPAKR